MKKQKTLVFVIMILFTVSFFGQQQTLPSTGNVTTDIIDKSNANFDELYSGIPRASSLGLLESNTGSQNATAFTTAVANNDVIYIDGMIPINTQGLNADFGGSITLVGNGATGFIMEGGAALFRPTTRSTLFKLDNLIFDDRLDTQKFILSGLSGQYCETIDVQNCKFYNKVMLVKLIGGDNDPAGATPGGCSNLIIKNNYCENIYDEFIYMEDCPMVTEIIEGNIIKNMNGVFYMSPRDNNSTNYGGDIVNVKEHTIIRNNQVLNDVDFFPATCPSTYMALAAIESKEVVYEGNIVSGLKCEAEQAIYDAYLSSGHVTYRNNVWLNNVCFDASAITNNQLIKGKSNASSDIAIPTRIYENNLWRVEDRWIADSGKTTADVWNNFSEVPPNCDFIFRNNVIDVKGLCTEISETDINSIIFDDNVIRIESFKAGSGGFLRYSPVNLSTKENSISRNNVQIVSEDVKMAFFDSSIGDGTWNTIRVNDNIIECDNESFTYFIAGTRVTNLIMNNNDLRFNPVATFLNVIATNFRGKNNNIDIGLNTSKIYGHTVDLGIETMDFELTSYNDGDTNIGVQNVPTDETWTELYITIETGLGIDIIFTKYRLFYDVDTWKLQMYNSSDALITTTIGGSNITPKIKHLGDYDSGMTLSYVNNSTSTFTMVSEPTGVIKKSIRHKTFLGSGDFANLLD